MHRLRDDPFRWLLGVSGALAIAIIIKVWLLKSGVVPFNSDEAIVALMARHILQGGTPVFFYGQAYMGSLDALLVAAGFYLFGNSVWMVRVIQIGLYAFTILTTAVLAWRLTGVWVTGVMAALVLAVPTINMALYTTVSLGGYGEMLLIGNLILLLTLKIVNEFQRHDKKVRLLLWFGLGFLCGLGLWVFGLTLVYSVPAIIYITWYWYRTRRVSRVNKPTESLWFNKIRSIIFSRKDEMVYPFSFLGIVAVGGIFGSFPFWAYAQRFGINNLITELGGGAIAGVESLGKLGQIFQHLLNLSIFGSTVILGIRPPWEIRWLALPLAPFVILLWIGVIIFAIRKIIRELKIDPSDSNYSHSPLLGVVVLMVLSGFIFTPFGADPSGRYFLPINIVLAIFAAQAFWKWRARFGNAIWAGFCMILVFNFWGTLQVASKVPLGMTTQFDAVTQIDHSYDDELIEFLNQTGENRGYTNYWVAYPLAFLSDESLIFVPRLPYHQDLRYTQRDDRYFPYGLVVDQADSTAYITTNNPPLDEQIRAGFLDLDVSWQETVIGDYQIYYQLSRAVEPEEIRFGGEY
jgi:hypothetical protein